MIQSRRGRRLAGLTLVLAVLAAVGALALASAGGDEDALVVYNGRSHYGGEAAFKRFERETGIKVKLLGGDAAELHERLVSEGKDTPADVLVTVDAANLWRAKDAGLLRPENLPALRLNAPAALRDPAGEWFAVSRRVRTVVRSPERVPAGAVKTYADLGDPRWRGKVCLRTSNNVYNQSFVADMLVKRGPERTEAMLRRWMANDPRILGSDVEVLKAIERGDCDLGLVNHYYLGRELEEDPRFPVAPVWVEQQGRGVHTNLSGAAVVKSSDRRAQAARLVAYLTEPRQQRDLAEKSEFPANPRVPPPAHIRKWTGFKTDPMDVAAAGREHDAAVRLMARVGWD